jgi:hypothetical protein
MPKAGICNICNSDNIITSSYNDQSIFRCVNCGHTWYGQRKHSGGFTSISDEILEEVNTNGICERDTSILLNTIFNNKDSNENTTFASRVQRWASAYYLQYYFSDDRKKIVFKKPKSLKVTDHFLNEVARRYISIPGFEDMITLVAFEVGNEYYVKSYKGNDQMPLPSYHTPQNVFNVQELLDLFEDMTTIIPKDLLSRLR